MPGRYLEAWKLFVVRLQTVRWQERVTRGLTPDWCLESWRHFVVRLQALRWQGPGKALPYYFR